MSKVTVIIPSYNHESYIWQRLESIRKQIFKDWVAIIIDDKSSDNSVSIIEDYLERHKDFNVKHFIKNEINSGSGYNAWQTGLALAETEFIWIAETDDYSDSKFLETTFIQLSENSEAALAFTASQYVDKDGDLLYTTNKRFAKLKLKQGDSNFYKADVFTQDLPLNPLITNGSSVLFRKPSHQLPGNIFSNKQLSDLFLWTHLITDSYFICINETLNYFRRHEASTTEINFGLNNEEVYKEYVTYANHFRSDRTAVIAILNHYIKHFLLPNRKKVGYFYTKPIEGLRGLSIVAIKIRIFKAYLKQLIN